MLTIHLQAIVTVISLMNPMVCAIIFGDHQEGATKKERIVASSKAAFAILLILEAVVLGGVSALEFFGISLDVFSIAGGGVLVWMGFSMLRSASQAAVKASSSDGSLTQLILFAASPGTITGVITLSISHTQAGVSYSTLLAVAVATFVTWLVLLAVAIKGKGDGSKSLTQSITQSLMGLIVMAMGLQLGLTGLVTFVKGAFQL